MLTASIIRAALMMEAVSTSEPSVNFYKTTWCNNAEDSHLQYNALIFSKEMDMNKIQIEHNLNMSLLLLKTYTMNIIF
jgi:hypothetical protein